ncbi:MAG: ATP-binding cassette domain-containing protein [Bacteroidota bacterium]
MIHTLEADSIQLEFDGRRILTDIYLKCETGKITGLLGRNGQGKSCMMKIIYGSLACEKSVRFDKISQPEAYKRPDLLLYLPQFNFIPKSLSLKRIFSDFELDYSLFEKKFPEFKSRYKSAIGRLSGGNYRLVELYIIVKSKSHFAMLDEPFTHLSPIQIENIKELLLEEKVNKGLLITDHMYRHIVDVCDNLYVLANGKMHLTKGIEDIETLGYARL